VAHSLVQNKEAPAARRHDGSRRGWRRLHFGIQQTIDEAIIEGPGSMVLALSFLSTAVCGDFRWFERHRSYNATFTPSFNFMVAG
jgi:hypothetical protein